MPAAQIIHLFKTERPGQVRGVPWMHAVMKNLDHINGYQEAELVAARGAAAKMGFFTSEDGSTYLGDDPDDDDTQPMVMDIEPGQFEQLPPGVNFTPYDPQHPTSAYASFMKAAVTSLASGLNVSYATLSSDLEGVNYSSIRSGVIDERDQWRSLQQWLSTHLHHRVYKVWLQQALTRQVLTIPARQYDKCLDVHWQSRGWQWVDPLKDQQAQQLAVEMGTATLTEICASQGKDFEDTCKQREVEKGILAKHNLTPDEVITNDDES